MINKLDDLEKVINSGLTTGAKSTKIKFNNLIIEIDIENINKTLINYPNKTLFCWFT